MNPASFSLRFRIPLPYSVALIVSLFGGALFAKPSEAPIVTGPAVELPVLEVKGNFQLPKAESWSYGRIEGFEILSNASDGKAARIVSDFHKFRQALDIARPIPVEPLASATIILCDRGDAFADFLPDDIGDREGLVSLLVRDHEKAAIIIDLEALDYEVQTRGGPKDLEVDHRRQLYREYARLLFTQADFPPPPWLLEANIQLMQDVETYGRVVNYGKVDITRGGPDAPVDAPGEDRDGATEEEGDPDAVDLEENTMANYMRRFMQGGALALWTSDPPYPIALAKTELMPLEQMFSVEANDPYARNPLVHFAWSKQAYAFLHYCKFGSKGELEQGFETFIMRLALEPVSEELFQTCFKMSYAEMEKKLAAFIRYPRIRYRHYKLAKEERPVGTDVDFRDATQGEIGRIKGDAQALAGLPDKALFTYRVAYERGERDPGLISSLARAELDSGNAEDAPKYIEYAIAAGANLPSAWTTLARIRLDEAIAAAGDSGSISAEQTVEVLKPLLKARAIEPAIPETYRIMAEAWERSAISPSSAHIDLVGEGCILFPAETDLAFRVAQLYAKAGNRERALDVARRGIQFASAESTKSSFQQLLDSLQSP